MTEDKHEFSAQQNRIILDLARKMGQVGVFLLVSGIVLIILFMIKAFSENNPYAIFGLSLAFYFMVTGVLALRSESAFRKIVETQGDDISYMMHALDELRRSYTLTFWLVLACLVLVVILIPGSIQNF